MASQNDSQRQLIRSLRVLAINKKLDSITFRNIEGRIRAGNEKFDPEALLAAAEKGHLTASNAVEHLIADAIARGKDAAASDKVTKTKTEVKHFRNPNGTISEVTQVTEHTVKKTIDVRNLGDLKNLPQDRTEFTVVGEVSAKTKGARIAHVDQVSVDSSGSASRAKLIREENARNTRQTVQVVEADGNGEVVSATTTEEKKPKATAPRKLRRHPERAAAKAPKPEADWRATHPCRNGATCRGRNGKCPYAHPERKEQPCWNGWGCRGRANGQCTFNHSAQEEKAAAPPAQDLSGIPADVRANYASFISETNAMRSRGEVKVEATWALKHEAQFATLLAWGLVPPLQDLQSAGFCSGKAAPSFNLQNKAAPSFSPQNKAAPSFSLDHLNISETPVRYCEEGKRVSIGYGQYYPVECGFKAQGGHSNMCFYLATCAGNRKKAVSMKEKLTPLADHISRTFGVRGTFTALGAPADIEVALAHVWTTGVPMCIASLDTGKAVFIRPHDGARGETVYLQLAREHYTRLVKNA